MEDFLHLHPNFGKKGVVKLLFPFGRDDWYFCYFTVWFIQQFYITKAFEDANQESIEQLTQLRVFELCKEVERSRNEMLDVKIDSVQTVFFMATVDNLADLMTQDTDGTFCDLLANELKTKIDRFASGKELEDYYLPIATDLIADVNSHYKTAEFGKKILKVMWSHRK